ncbi:MAG: polysaccharide deacetylase family protein [Candidatus Delongbacteria bacterium]|nr:polysaccharide deacetylase family protein [Candidatus Delongbacteria bacterium]MBN2834623.1 polysaccharide deacetylase family protein [Candidatus Delongbacteria bacterium]
MKKILTYHKVGVNFDSSLCFVDSYRFKRDMELFLSLKYNLNTVSDNCSSNDLSIIFDDGYENVYKFKDYFIEKNIRTTIFIITDFIGKLDNWDVSLSGIKHRHLTKDMIKNLSLDRHEIGSHSCSHKDLTLLSSSALNHELLKSREVLEDIIGKKVKSISVPFGRINSRVIDVAKEIGYENIVYLGQNKKLPHSYRSKQVYLFDNETILKAKLGLNRWSSIEDFRLNAINFFNRGTLLAVKLSKMMDYFKNN